jgi:peptidoglycan/LPS O-acetylase OafA/YrhL
VPLLDRDRLSYRSDGLDLLRALLAIWVIVSHFAVWGALSDTGSPDFLQAFQSFTASTFQDHGGTNPAVLAFIVLSGYCIHRSGARRGGWSIRRYAIVRAYRIWPVYLAASLVGVAMFLGALQANAPLARQLSGTEAVSAGCVAAKLTGISAFVPPLHDCAFQGNAPLSTVMVEIWLYVAYALGAALLLRGFRERALWGLVGAVYLSGFIFVASNADYLSWWSNGSFAGFLLYWWIGAGIVARSWTPATALVGAAACVPLPLRRSSTMEPWLSPSFTSSLLRSSSATASARSTTTCAHCPGL